MDNVIIFFKLIKRHLPFFAIILMMVLQNQWLDETTEHFALELNQDNYALSYRWLTAHLVHSNGIHLVLNLTAFMVIYALFFPVLGWHFYGIILTSSFTISGMYMLAVHPYDAYVGLSGCLHGLLIAGAIQQYGMKLHRASNAIIILSVVIKLVHEQAFGPNQQTEKWIEAAVAVDAHLYGALGAVGYAMIWRLYQRYNNVSSAR